MAVEQELTLLTLGRLGAVPAVDDVQPPVFAPGHGDHAEGVLVEVALDPLHLGGVEAVPLHPVVHEQLVGRDLFYRERSLTHLCLVLF